MIQASPQQLFADRVCLTRRHKIVLNDIGMSVRPGEVIAILGANGAGKSTLLSTLAGELSADNPDSTIAINGHHLDTLNRMQQARQRSVLPQKSGLAFDLDVSQVVAMGSYPYPEMNEEITRQLMEQAMRHAHISELSDRRYLELSGGEQQRVHYARAVLQILCGLYQDKNGRYILMDEPTSSLDPLHQHMLLDSARTLARDHRLGVLVILHDVNLAALFSDRIVLLCDGRVLACDAPGNVLTAENLFQVYGVHAMVMPHPRHTDKTLVVFG